MKSLTLEQHKARLANLRRANADVRACVREWRISNYLPGQIIYYLGDYPAPMSITPTDYDYRLLKSYAENGVGMIQVHEEWNDTIRRFGATKYTSCDSEGMKRFVDLCHYFGIKIIPYCSASYIHRKDSEYSEEFSRCDGGCTDMHYSYRLGWAGSARWRDFILPRTFNIMDTYGFDGIFNDWGYDWYDSVMKNIPPDREDLRNEPLGQYDPEAEDLIHMLYDGIHERGGIYKLHVGGNTRAPVRGKYYDYLWVGEGVGSSSYGAGKLYEPYLVPCPDKRLLQGYDPDAYFAMSIPFIQFPLLTHGRPTMGDCVDVPGVEQYNTDDPKRLYQFFKDVRAYMNEHPNGPYVYSEWSPIPDDPQDYDRWCRYLALYQPMVENGSVVYMELRDTALVQSNIPENVYISLFVNEKTYLAVSNLQQTPYELTLRDVWKDRVSGVEGHTFTIPPQRIAFFQLNDKEVLQ